jgi:hypothetical protein
MIPLNQFLEVIKKHGATGVLAAWLFYTHMEVQDVKDRLYNCLETRDQISQNKKEYPIIPKRNDSLAILPDDGKRSLRR